ncbi:MAG TPA: dihydroorotate dehydrogenase [Syntrophorhabdales bacterium]|nr:dihydroorotate dehydrogenase [Syntrophorhabdales bacterium]
MATLSIDLFGKTLRNPVMNGSGTLGYGREIEPLWPIDTLGAYVTKGLSLKPHHGNPPPRVWEEGRGMLNSIGLQNVGLERFFAEHFPLFKERNTPIVINFFGFTDEEYIECAASIEPDPLIIALEINLSCPNVTKGGICMGKEAQGVFSIIKRVKEITLIPVIAKLTPEVADIVEIARAAVSAGADGITLINTMPGAAIDFRTLVRGNLSSEHGEREGEAPTGFPVEGATRAPVMDMQTKRMAFRGGLSGPPLKPIALKAVADVSRAVTVPVIGAGGIMNHEDAIQFLMAGARAIQVGTATFVDPFAIPKILAGLATYMDEHGLSRLSTLVGAAYA